MSTEVQTVSGERGNPKATETAGQTAAGGQGRTGRFKILAADKLAEEGVKYVQDQQDAELIYKPGLNEQELAEIIGDHDGVIIRSGVQITDQVLAKPGRLKAIARAGVGVDNIDLQAATARGILVMNSAEASTISTAEHAFAVMIALARQIGPAYRTMYEGGWDRAKFKGFQLSGKTLGVVGFGRIGRTVAERGLAFGMKVLAFDPFFNAPSAMDGQVKLFSQFAELLPHVDVVTFHVPLTDQTRGMMNAQMFGLARKGVVVVNAARGGIVDEAALLEALDSGQCGGAAMDVFETEPPPADHPLRKHPKVLVTPHLGASTVEAQRAVSVDAAAGLLAYLRGEGVPGAVNAGGLRLDLDPVQERFVDLGQRMSRLVSPMVSAGIRSVTFEIAGEGLAKAVPTVERMGLIGLLTGHLDVPLNVVNVRSVAEQRGIAVKTVTTEEDKLRGPEMAIQIEGPDQSCRIVGKVYQDLKPRVIEVNGYHMDIVPSGVIVVIQNEDQPGMVGLVGTDFGQAGVNIADMAISRRDSTALMILKLDAEPPESLLNRLKHRPGIVRVMMVKLPE